MKNLLLALLLISSAAFAQKPELVKDINPNGDSNPFFLAQIGGLAFFSANNGTNGFELWVSNGTETGTYMVKDINPNGNSSIFEYIAHNGKLYFSAYNGNDEELWVSDGTSSGTVLLKDINPGGTSLPAEFAAYKGKLYFQANDGTNGAELWVTDGTSAGTQMVKDVNPSGSSAPVYLVPTSNGLYFLADVASGALELWRTDGTSAGTISITQITSVNIGGQLRLIGNVGADVVLNVYNSLSSNSVLLRIDGNGGVVQLADNVETVPVMFGSKIYFSRYDAGTDEELWVSDGTVGGTTMLKDINTTSGGSFPRGFTGLNGKIYFVADNDITIPGFGTNPVSGLLYETDGTTNGTKLVNAPPTLFLTFMYLLSTAAICLCLPVSCLVLVAALQLFPNTQNVIWLL